MSAPVEGTRIDIGLYREAGDVHNIMVCFNIDCTVDQRRLLQHTEVPVSPESIKECLTKIVCQFVDKSIFGGGENGSETEAGRPA